MTFTLYGAPRTKKNSSRIARAGRRGRIRILPSEAHEAWKAKALPQAEAIAGRYLFTAPFSEPVNVRATFYRDALRGDAVGYYQALADLMQAAGLVVDDKWIVSWDGSRLAKDKKDPRIEVTVEAVGVK